VSGYIGLLGLNFYIESLAFFVLRVAIGFYAISVSGWPAHMYR